MGRSKKKTESLFKQPKYATDKTTLLIETGIGAFVLLFSGFTSKTQAFYAVAAAVSHLAIPSVFSLAFSKRVYYYLRVTLLSIVLSVPHYVVITVSVFIFRFSPEVWQPLRAQCQKVVVKMGGGQEDMRAVDDTTYYRKEYIDFSSHMAVQVVMLVAAAVTLDTVYHSKMKRRLRMVLTGACLCLIGVDVGWANLTLSHVSFSQSAYTLAGEEVTVERGGGGAAGLLQEGAEVGLFFCDGHSMEELVVGGLVALWFCGAVAAATWLAVSPGPVGGVGGGGVGSGTGVGGPKVRVR